WVLPIQGTDETAYLYMGDRWAGAWDGPVNESRYVWLPLTFPDSRTMSMSWAEEVTIDTETGQITAP
ncbi:beta-xylosidase, partial [Streptomyces sp. 6N223]